MKKNVDAWFEIKTKNRTDSSSLFFSSTNILVLTATAVAIIFLFNFLLKISLSLSLSSLSLNRIFDFRKNSNILKIL